MINQVKGEIIPMITNELQNVKIPDINEEIEAGKVGKVAFGVKGVAMSQVIVPSDKLKVTMNGAQISIEMYINNIVLFILFFNCFLFYFLFSF